MPRVSPDDTPHLYLTHSPIDACRGVHVFVLPPPRSAAVFSVNNYCFGAVSYLCCDCRRRCCWCRLALLFLLKCVVYCEQEVARERVAQMITRGVPVLDERDVRKATEVQLTALCSWATVPMVASVACTFARGVTYACTSAAGEAPVGVPASANSANYFEVTVMNPGEKTTIGIGLADPDVFPATKQMPGWVDHSYGYHGDDGRKFGRGKTDSIWPIWADGDVIGCGFDPVRGAIWWVGKPANSERACCRLRIAPMVRYTI